MDEELKVETEEEMEQFLADAIEGYADAEYGVDPRIDTFAQAGVLTGNHGLVVRLGDTEWQLTIVRSR